MLSRWSDIATVYSLLLSSDAFLPREHFPLSLAFQLLPDRTIEYTSVSMRKNHTLLHPLQLGEAVWKGKLCLPRAVITKSSCIVLAFLPSFISWGVTGLGQDICTPIKHSLAWLWGYHIKTISFNSNLVHNILAATEKQTLLIWNPHAWK